MITYKGARFPMNALVYADLLLVDYHTMMMIIRLLFLLLHSDRIMEMFNYRLQADKN